MKFVPNPPLQLSAADIRLLRNLKTRASSRYTISGRIRSKQPAPITLRLKDKPCN